MKYLHSKYTRYTFNVFILVMFVFLSTFSTTGADTSSLTITTNPPLPQGEVGIPYDGLAQASAGSSACTWSVFSGSLPTGLILQSGQDVGACFTVLKGTPTVEGNFTFVIMVTSSNKSFNKEFSLTIRPKKGVFLIDPKLLEIIVGTAPFESSAVVTEFRDRSPGCNSNNPACDRSSNVLAQWTSGNPSIATFTCQDGTGASSCRIIRVSSVLAGETTINATYINTDGKVYNDSAIVRSKIASTPIPNPTPVPTPNPNPTPNPTLTITSPLVVQETMGKPFSYQITTNFNPNIFDAFILPLGLSINSQTGLISGVSGVFGDFGVALSAGILNDISKQALAGLNLSFLPNPGVPIITSPISVTGTAGKPFSYQITATNNPTSFDISDLRNGFSIDKRTGLISGPSTTNENISLTLKATNDSGTGVARIFLFIKDFSQEQPSVPHVIPTSPVSAAAIVGTPFSYQIVGTQTTTTNHPISFDAFDLPPGLSVNTKTGVISGIPTTHGVFDVGLKVDTFRFESFRLFIFDTQSSSLTTSSTVSSVTSISSTDVRNQISTTTSTSSQDTTQTSFPHQTVVVTASVLNVRNSPGVRNKIVGRVRQDNILEKVETKNGWVKVVLPNGQTGWVFGKFVK